MPLQAIYFRGSIKLMRLKMINLDELIFTSNDEL